jgi:hypothetical protein
MLEVWIRERGQWFGRVRGPDGRTTWISAADLHPTPLNTHRGRSPPRGAGQRPGCDSRNAAGDDGVMAWRCGKCDGANVPAHSQHCPRRAELHLDYVAGWGLLPKIQPRPRATDAPRMVGVSPDGDPTVRRADPA